MGNDKSGIQQLAALTALRCGGLRVRVLGFVVRGFMMDPYHRFQGCQQNS